ncbi:MAG TPA: hypothetical protein VGR43_01400 [Dehalococcoidia bacterium]|nr:hypothetical protein [Dehalococcoidia bacterium]
MTPHRASAVFALALILILAVGSTACDPGAEITWVNETDQTVYIYLGDDLDDFDGTVQPRSSSTVTTIEAVWSDIVVVRDVNGTVLLREEITWEQLEERDVRFVITSGAGRSSARP